MAKSKKQLLAAPNPAAMTEQKTMVGKVLKAGKPGTIHRSEIRFAPYNPRSIAPGAFRRLCNSVRKFGLVEPPVVNIRTDNTVVGGHQRIKALDTVLETEDYELNVFLIDVDITTEKELNVALNNPTMQGQFDLDVLQDVIGQISQADDGDVHATGFATSDLHMMFGDDFLQGVFAEQRDDEKPTVDVLEEIRQAGRDEEKAAIAAAPPSTGQPAAPSDEQTAADDGVGAGGDGAGADAPSRPPADILKGPKPDPHTDPEGYAAYKRAMHEARHQYIADKTSDEDAADTLVTLVFDDPGQIARFLKHFELDQQKRYFDAVEFASAVGVTL